MAETDQFAPELLISPRPGNGAVGRADLERELREAIRAGRLHAGTALPSTRALARELGVARSVVVEAYEQLAAQGLLVTRQGARTRVAEAGPEPEDLAAAPREPLGGPPAPYDLRAWLPDLSSFPRRQWRRSLDVALATTPDTAFDYSDPWGDPDLRASLAAFLGRSRGVRADAAHTVITAGASGAVALLGRVLARAGPVAVESPGFPVAPRVLASAGVELERVPVDEDGIRVDALDATSARAVLVTPAHQFPTGVRLSRERRADLLGWARTNDALVLEDDYDGEYRYDGAGPPALQGDAPDRVVYLGTASKVLAPSLRLGWMVVPDRLGEPMQDAMRDGVVARLEQRALLDFIERGEVDRHLRRMRTAYRRRRGLLVDALRSHLPHARVTGAAAGLHLVAELPGGAGARAFMAAARSRGVAVHAIDRRAPDGLPVIAAVIGFANVVETSIDGAVRELAAAHAAMD